MNRELLARKIFQNMSAMRRLMFTQGAHGAATKGVPSRARLGVLFTIDTEGALSIKELSERFGVSPSAVTQLVDSLVKDALLKRIEDKKDRRKIAVSLTVLGKKKITQAKNEKIRSLSRIFAALTEEELRQFENLQAKIIKSSE